MAALRYRAVLFDLDGTLVDSYAALADAVNYARREHGLAELDYESRKQKAESRKQAVLLSALCFLLFRCQAADALFVGDMPVDVEAARNSGIDVAVLTTGSSTYDQLREARPDHMLGRFSDLLEVVRNGASA